MFVCVIMFLLSSFSFVFVLGLIITLMDRGEMEVAGLVEASIVLLLL